MIVEADIVRRSRERVGSILRGKYRLDRLVGVGGMGSVFAATHRNNKNKVAIKILHAELSVNAVIRRRFLREGYIANTVDHPGIVRVLDDDVTDDGSVYLVLELLEGETLADRQAALSKLSATEVTRVAIDLCDILAAAHDKGVIHRDIKPDNVFVTTRGAVKILDFGVARLREEAGPDAGPPAPTRSGHSVGTPAYMAPEQALGLRNKVGPASDLWSVGAMMFTLLAGRFVHDAESPGALLVRAATQPVAPIASIEPTVPPALAQVIDKAMSFEIEDRWATATEMRRELAVVLRAMQARVKTVEDAPRDEDQPAIEDFERATTERPPPFPLVRDGEVDSLPAFGISTLQMPTRADDALAVEAESARPPPLTIADDETSSRRRPRWFAAAGLALACAAVIFVVSGAARRAQQNPARDPTTFLGKVAIAPAVSSTPPVVSVSASASASAVPIPSSVAIPIAKKVKPSPPPAPRPSATSSDPLDHQ